ncbi:MAG: MCE family protein [Deltaproteobacteria bacterium]|nr:MCE family protein [Deltaproteobacteria bacterium]MBW1896973.1 MCE family protein [Deltaproteobacteria bacterium]
MTKLSAEAKVGFFVVIGMLILAYMSMKAGQFEYVRDKGYDLYADFDSAEGIVKGVPVEIAGVEVGRVKDIRLEAGKARITLQMNPEIQIGDDSQAIIRSKGVLGDKYVEIVLGSPGAQPIQADGQIARTQSPANIDTLLKQLSAIGTDIKNITESLSGVLGGKEGESSLRAIVDNMRELTETLNETVQNNNQNINQMLDNFAGFSGDLRELSGTNKESVAEIVDNFRQASGQLREALVVLNQIADKVSRGEGTIGKLIQDEETVERLDETLLALKEITEKINRGEGSLGKLVQEDETVDNMNTTLESINEYLRKEGRFRTYLDYSGEYLFEQEALKSYLSLRIQPKQDKYYLLGIVDDPAGQKTRTEERTIVDGEEHIIYREKIDKDAIKWTAQIAKRYYDLGLRAGIFESSGGIGADYYLYDDRLICTFEAFDFDPDENPHLKLRAEFTPLHFIYVTAGYDNIISKSDNESFFLGFGLRFSDEDIKTLMTEVPRP